MGKGLQRSLHARQTSCMQITQCKVALGVSPGTNTIGLRKGHLTKKASVALSKPREAVTEQKGAETPFSSQIKSTKTTQQRSSY